MNLKTLSLVSTFVLLLVLVVVRELPRDQGNRDQNAAKDADSAHPEGNGETANSTAITDDQAIALALKAIGGLKFDQGATIRVQRLEGKICVMFPILLPKPPPGMLVK